MTIYICLLSCLDLHVKDVNEEKSQQFYARKLVYFIVDHILLNEDCEISNLIEEVPILLFAAAEVGNTEFVIALIDYYPDLIWQENYRNQSIFHVAILHRHQRIFNLLHEIGSIGSLIATRKDRYDGNNMLHLAATLAPQEKLNKVSGAALQMQQDLLWYMVTVLILKSTAESKIMCLDKSWRKSLAL